MTHGPEFHDVERPFLDQLAALGWKIVTGNLDFPSATGRGSFREVLLAASISRRSCGRRGGASSTLQRSPDLWHTHRGL